MLEAWLNFIIVVFVQLLFFVIHAYYKKRLNDLPRILGRSVLVGTVFGLLVDLIGGKLLGLHSYTLGFGAFFLILNWVFLNGFFVANILLLQRGRLPYLYIWTIIFVAIYEIPNHFFRVWTWEFNTLPHIEYLVILSAGYFGGAILVATMSHMFLGRRFLFIDNLFKK